MKKLFSILLVVLILTTLLASCGSPKNTDTDSQDKENTETNTGLILPNMTIVNKEHNYYPYLKNKAIKYNGNDFPDKKGKYIKLIETADEFQLCIENCDIDGSIFENNYVLVLNINWEYTLNSWRTIGYYNLRYEEGEYIINMDRYLQNEGDKMYPQATERINTTNCFIVPKTEIESFDGVKDVRIDDEDKTRIDERFARCSYLKSNTTPPSSQNANIWVKTDETEEILSETLNLSLGTRDGIIIYLPFELQGDIIVSACELEGDVINVVFENYTHIDNVYMQENEVNYYFLRLNGEYGYMINPNEITEDYSAHITINVINIDFI